MVWMLLLLVLWIGWAVPVGAQSCACDPSPLQIAAPAALPDGYLNVVYSQPLTSTVSTPPYVWSLAGGALPAGLALTTAGVLQGTPTAVGIYSFTLRVQDAAPLGARVATKPVTLTIAANPPYVPLRNLAAPRGFQIGTAVRATALQSDPAYGSVLAREFGAVTPENEMKWATIHPGPTTYDFAAADLIVNAAVASGQQVHGHTLVWYDALPAWLTGGTYNRAQLIAILQDHIGTVVGRYRGRVQIWDVVNEDPWGQGFWYVGIGPDYRDLAFRAARQADPAAVLLYNDWGCEYIGSRSTNVLAMLTDMRSRGVPVDGMGFQFHLTYNDADSFYLTSMRNNFARFAQAGLQLYITEMDVRVWLPPSPDILTLQTNTYRNILDVCLSFPACKGLSTWGFTDRYSWIPDYFPGMGQALLFDGNYQPKATYGAVNARLAQIP